MLHRVDEEQKKTESMRDDWVTILVRDLIYEILLNTVFWSRWYLMEGLVAQSCPSDTRNALPLILAANCATKTHSLDFYKMQIFNNFNLPSKTSDDF